MKSASLPALALLSFGVALTVLPLARRRSP